jgi:hypothetical protein
MCNNVYWYSTCVRVRTCVCASVRSCVCVCVCVRVQNMSVCVRARVRTCVFLRDTCVSGVRVWCARARGCTDRSFHPSSLCIPPPFLPSSQSLTRASTFSRARAFCTRSLSCARSHTHTLSLARALALAPGHSTRCRRRLMISP